MELTVARQSYAELIRGNFKSLGYFIDEALSSKDSYTFFRLIADSIVPLIRRAPAFETFYLDWIEEKGKYKSHYAKTEKAAIAEIHDTFDAIKSALIDLDLIENSAVNSSISSIENVLEFREPYIMPAYYEIAYDRIAQLLHLLLTLDQGRLVEKYAELGSINKSQLDPKTNEYKTIPEPHISLFTFAPSLKELKDLRQVFSWENYSNPWSIWEHLDLAYWCWQTPFSYFKDKKLEHGDAKECADSSFLLNLHAFWVEMNTIKKRTQSLDKILFFKRDRFTDYLKVIVHQVILYQEIHGPSDAPLEASSPFALELKLDFGRLILKVEWFEGIKAEEYIIHTFNDESGNHEFIHDLLAAKPNTLIDISGYASGATVAKFISRIKLQNTLLAEIFFIRKNTHEISLRSKRVELSKLPDINLPRLREQIKQFEPTDKRWLDMQNPQPYQSKR